MIKSYSSSLRAKTFMEEVLEEVNASDPEEALQLLRRMKSVLSQYYQERKKLQTLGLENLDEALDAMMAMKNRVDTMRDQLEAYRQAQTKLHAIQDALDVDADAEETVETIENINRQLETLYEEKEVLSQAGLSDANEAVHVIQSMQDQLDELYEEQDSDLDPSDSDPSPLDLLEEKLGISDPESAIEMIENMERQLTTHIDAPAGSSPSPDASEPEAEGEPSVDVYTLERQLLALQEGDVDLPTDEFAALLPHDTRSSLDEHTPEELDALEVGVLAVDDNNHIRAVNGHEPPLPGLEDDPIGASFLDQIPSSRNPLLQLPLQTGRQNGTLDARFTYTFPRPEDDAPPLPVKLHLHRSPHHSVTWILYETL